MNNRFRRAVTTAAVVLTALFLSATAWADPPSQVGRLSFLDGTVSFRPGTLDDWSPAALNYPLSEGDQVWTDQDGRAEIHVGSTALRLGAGTDFTFLNLDDQTVQIRLATGELNVRLRRLDPGDAFEVDTPNSIISLDSVGSYRIDVQADGESSVVIVRQGQAGVMAGTGSFTVVANQAGTVSGTGSVSYFVQGATAPDDLDSWSFARDAREDRTDPLRFLPREMIGVEDLDGNGVWVTMAGYGPVWQPTRIPAGWAPYRFGHWAWVEPWGWTWIDSAAWGFAPFHYGRWAFLSARWVWVPGQMIARPVYAPALVVFVGGDAWRPSGGEGIGWFPLGPREIYVPPYAVTPRYLQGLNMAMGVTANEIEMRQRIDASQIRYVNRTIPRAVTVIPRQAFIQSRSADAVALPLMPADLGRAPIMGATAALVPQRESIVGQPFGPQVIVRQPPANVVNRPVFSARTPPAPPVPFAVRQQALNSNPGRPVDPALLSGMQPNIPPRRPPVTRFGEGGMAPRPGQPQPQQPIVQPQQPRQPGQEQPRPGQQPIQQQPQPQLQPVRPGQPQPQQPIVQPQQPRQPGQEQPRPGQQPIQQQPQPQPQPVRPGQPQPQQPIVQPQQPRQPGQEQPRPGQQPIQQQPQPQPQPVRPGQPQPQQPIVQPQQPRQPGQEQPRPGQQPIQPQPQPQPVRPGQPQPQQPIVQPQKQPGQEQQKPVQQPQQQAGQEQPRPGQQPQLQQPKQEQPRPAQQQPQQPAQPQKQPGQEPQKPVQQPQQQAGQDVKQLANTLRTQSLPNAEKHLADARNVKGNQIDVNDVQRQITAARSLLSGIDSDLAQGRVDQARQKAQQAQQQIAGIEAAIAAGSRSGGN